MRKLARVVFDEAHSEAWTIRPELATAIQASHPQDSSYARAAAALRGRDFDVAVHAAGALSADALALADVLVLAHPSDPKWERTVPGGSPVLSPEEIDAVEAFVRGGGGLLVLGEEEQEKYGNNLNELLERFGLHLDNTVVSDYDRFHQAPSWVLADLEAHRARAGADLLTRVHEACFYRATTVAAENRRPRPRPHLAGRVDPERAARRVAEHGPVASRSSPTRTCSATTASGELDHEAAVAEPPVLARRAGVRAGRARRRLRGRGGTRAGLGSRRRPTRCACCRSPTAAPPRTPRRPPRTSTRWSRRSRASSPTSPTRPAYLDAVGEDLRAWADGGFAKPDFTRSLELFRPEQQRADGVEHLVVFPMYLQNASRDTRFEALIIRVPWPEWLAELERTRYDNAKFVPVTFVDRTAGYDSECAVPVPETVSVAAGRSTTSARSSATARPSASAASSPRPRGRRPEPPARRRRRCCAPSSSRATPTCCGTSCTTARTRTATCRSTRS
jgi:hypothetical protein